MAVAMGRGDCTNQIFNNYVFNQFECNNVKDLFCSDLKN